MQGAQGSPSALRLAFRLVLRLKEEERQAVGRALTLLLESSGEDPARDLGASRIREAGDAED